jgi:peroxiredoxin Q/BCP
MLRVGDTAPDFESTTQTGKPLKLSDLRGKRVVLFFFPRAFTMGCTIETRKFRDQYGDLSAMGAEIIGVSVDSHARQCDFANSEGVPFPMLGDESREISRRYGVLRSLLQVSQRVTYVIGPTGQIELVANHELLVNKHIDDVSKHLRAHAGKPA